MPDEVVTIGLELDSSGFKKGVNSAKKNVQALGSKTKDAMKGASQSVDQTATTFRQKLAGSQFAKNFSFLASLSPQFEGVKKQFEEVGDSASKAGAKGKLAMAGMGIVLAGAVIGVVSQAMQKAWNALKDWVKKANPIGFDKTMAKMEKAIDKMQSALGNVLEPVFETIATIIEGIANGITAIMEGIMYVRGFLNGLFGKAKQTNESLADTGEAIEEASETASEGLAGFDKLNTLGDVSVSGLEESQKMQDLMDSAYATGENIKTGIKDFFLGDLCEWGEKAGGAIQNAGESAWNGIKTAGSKIFNFWRPIFTSQWELYKTLGEKAWNGLKDIGSKVGDSLSSLGEKAWDTLKTAGTKVVNFWKTLFASQWNLYKTLGSSAWDAIKSAGSSMWSALKTAGSSMWNGVQTAGTTVWNVLETAGTSVWDAIKSAGSSVCGALSGMFGGIWDGMESAFKKVGNAIISIFNEIIKGYNSTIGSFSVDVFGYHIGFPSLKEIPALAQGGVVAPNDPQLAVVGDNKRESEIISPVSTMKEAFKEAMAEGGYSNSRPVNLEVKLDSRVLGRAVYDPIRQEARRRGKGNIL